MKQTKKRPHFARNLIPLALIPFSLAAEQGEEENRLDTIHVSETTAAAESNHSYNQGYGAYGTSTATGLPMSLRQTPQNVSIVSAQQIKDQNLNTLGEVVQRAVGLYTDIKGSPQTGYTVLYARGNKVENFQLDGMPTNTVALGGKGPGDLPNAWNILNTVQYDRVEVLRGATALMDGSGQPSATISLHRKRPTATAQGNVDFKFGSNNLYGVETDISGPLNESGTVHGRLVGAYLGQDSEQKRSNNRNGMLYGIVEWDISPATTLSVGGTYQYMRDRNSSMFGLVMYDTDGYAIYSNPKQNATINGSYVNYQNLNMFTELRHRFNSNWELKAEYGYAEGHRDQVAGIAGSAFVARSSSSIMGVGAIVRSDERPKQHNFSLSLTGKYDLWGRQHDVMFGASAYSLKSDQPRYLRQTSRISTTNIDTLSYFDGDYPIGDWSASAQDVNHIDQIGGYGATRMFLLPDLALILGGRYTYFKAVEETQYINGRNTESKVTPYVGLVYDLTENLSVYTSYAQIFKPQTKADRNGNYLAPEKGSNVELGLKGEFFGGRLNSSLALFETRKSNVSYCASYGAGNLTCNYYDVDPKTKTRGFEIEVNGLITDNWAISAGFSRAKGKTPDGKRITPEVPTEQFKLFSSYQWDKLTVGAGLRWQNEINEKTPWGLSSRPTAEQEARARIPILMARLAPLWEALA